MATATVQGSGILRFSEEKLTLMLARELTPLILDHAEQLNPYHGIRVEPDFKAYFGLADAGALKIFTARTEDRVLAGYCIFVVSPNPHCRGSLQATQDAFFLAVPFRKGLAAAMLLRHCDEQLAAASVAVVHHYVRPGRDFGPILKRMGYAATGQLFSRRIS